MAPAGAAASITLPRTRRFGRRRADATQRAERTVRATDEAITASDHGPDRSRAWGAEARLRVLTGGERARLVGASGAFELASRPAEVSRETGVSELDLRPAPATPVARWDLTPKGHRLAARAQVPRRSPRV
jgi:hypothetical protein